FNGRAARAYSMRAVPVAVPVNSGRRGRQGPRPRAVVAGCPRDPPQRKQSPSASALEGAVRAGSGTVDPHSGHTRVRPAPERGARVASHGAVGGGEGFAMSVADEERVPGLAQLLAP